MSIQNRKLLSYFTSELPVLTCEGARKVILNITSRSSKPAVVSQSCPIEMFEKVEQCRVFDREVLRLSIVVEVTCTCGLISQKNCETTLLDVVDAAANIFVRTCEFVQVYY